MAGSREKTCPTAETEDRLLTGNGADSDLHCRCYEELEISTLAIESMRLASHS